MAELEHLPAPKGKFTLGPECYQKCLDWVEECELPLNGPLASKSKAVKANYVLIWTGKAGRTYIKSLNLTTEEKGDPNVLFKKFVEWTKPKSNALTGASNFPRLEQGDLSLAEYIDKATILCHQCEYPPKARDRLLRDAIVIGLRYKCIEKANHYKWKFINSKETGNEEPTGTDSSNRDQLPVIRNREGQRGKLVSIVERNRHVPKQYGDVFQGIGTLPGGLYRIQLKEGYNPIQHPPRQVAVSLKPPYKAELERLTQLGVIKEVREYTEWINSIVPVKKLDGSLRLCLDPKDLKRAIKRNQWYSSLVDDILLELANSKYFSLLKAKSGYWHISLDKESSYLTTFNTPWGKYRWLRLPFGLKVSGDVFQERIDRELRSVPNSVGIVDDILCRGNEETTHDVAVITLLETARVNNLTFNANKFVFKSQDCTFFGGNLTPAGYKMDPKEVQAITEIKPPVNLQDLQSFLGLSKASNIQSDASNKGLGAVLLQDDKPVIYASRVLTETEQPYSNIERELLSVVFALERFHHYVYGYTATVQTDHKPLVSVWKESIVCNSPRLQRLLLRLSQYDVNIEYLIGKDNVVADALSRVSPQPKPKEGEDEEDFIPVHMLKEEIPADSTRVGDFRRATAEDTISGLLMQVVANGWPELKKDCPPTSCRLLELQRRDQRREWSTVQRPSTHCSNEIA
ncbi:Retrovirus-related Pol polyprotein from transposon 17.6 [Stylophora pistillata]|uniref:Retrovirus-related Pol polyprotein from transposon 17.6 n=1 Tax=Stylophora pistillata TaxID=50429 RepID=A0A2B4SYM1_STYPI|nr:Retrovirus-related Pol polyprotein from transposon 17.6 [Stylophora pistillata]